MCSSDLEREKMLKGILKNSAKCDDQYQTGQPCRELGRSARGAGEERRGRDLTILCRGGSIRYTIYLKALMQSRGDYMMFPPIALQKDGRGRKKTALKPT